MMLIAASIAPCALSAFKHVPVGPVKNRTIDEAKVTYYVSLNGKDTNNGKTRNSAFRTMQKAADTVKPGDTVLVLKGVYQRGFHINKIARKDAWISFIAEPGVTIKGSDIVRNWNKEGKGVYSIPRPKLLGNWQTPEIPLQRRLEQVFVDGKLLRQVSEKQMLKPVGVFYVDDKAEKLYVCLKDGYDPGKRKTEVSYRTWAIAIGARPNMNFWRYSAISKKSMAAYIKIDGFTIRHIASFMRMAAIQIRGTCNNITVKNCDVQWTSSIGAAANSLTIWSPAEKKWLRCLTSHVIFKNNILSNNGAQGCGGGGASYLLVENNIIDNNNFKGISPWNEGGAVKTGFGGSHIIIRNNVARNNHNHGLWFDYGSTNCVFENNFVYNSIAGAILNEVTPPGKRVYDESGKRKFVMPNAAEVKKSKQTGTVIRNNILIATRTPGGGGINVSSSVDSRVYNNICYNNAGGGLNCGGSPTRINIQGLFRNHFSRNICAENFLHATVNSEQADKSGRTFDNVFKDNIFIKAKNSKPFKIDGALCDIAAFQKFNKGIKNYYSDKNIFKDPQHFDFRVSDSKLVAKAGFDQNAMRLDWSEFYIVEKSEDRKFTRRQDFVSIKLDKVLNRPLSDQTAFDGKGGWTDHGPNDMSKLPTGNVLFDGVKYDIKKSGNAALLMATTNVKGSFPEQATVDVNGKFNDLYFLYAAAWAGNTVKVNGENVKVDEPLVKIIVNYQNGSSKTIPLTVGKHVLDWWVDPTWQQYAKLNDNSTYTAWQGPNRATGKVTAYYYKFNNPDPDKEIKSITISKAGCRKYGAFFLLGITGGRDRAKGPVAFYLGFDGAINAKASDGGEIEAGGFTKMAFDGGKFEEGKKDRGYRPAKPVFYDVPSDFPTSGQGTISVWLKADDWTTPERVKYNKRLNYPRTMTPLEVRQAPERYSPWGISFEISKKDYKSLSMIAPISGRGGKSFDVSGKIKPGKWFKVTVTWWPEKRGTRRKIYLDDKLVNDQLLHGKADLVGKTIYIGVPKNGGQPWRGVMDELTISKLPIWK